MTLYQLLTGHLPFQCFSLVGEIEAKLKGDRKALREHVASIPKELEDIIDRALNPLPGNRFQSAKEFRHDLIHLLCELKKNTEAELSVELELTFIRSWI